MYGTGFAGSLTNSSALRGAAAPPRTSAPPFAIAKAVGTMPFGGQLSKLRHRFAPVS